MKFFERFIAQKKSVQEISPTENITSPNDNLEEPVERDLMEKTIKKILSLSGGEISSARLIQFESGDSAVFKPYSKYSEEEADLRIARERASYLVSRFLGFNFVPPTVIRAIRQETGSLQEFIENAPTAEEVDYDRIDQHELAKLWAFDEIILNHDRHPGNYLVKNNKIYAIDHGHAFFATDNPPRQPLFIPGIPKETQKTILEFSKDTKKQNDLRTALQKLFDEEVADFFIKRILYFANLLIENNNA